MPVCSSSSMQYTKSAGLPCLLAALTAPGGTVSRGKAYRAPSTAGGSREPKHMRRTACCACKGAMKSRARTLGAAGNRTHWRLQGCGQETPCTQCPAGGCKNCICSLRQATGLGERWRGGQPSTARTPLACSPSLQLTPSMPRKVSTTSCARRFKDCERAHGGRGLVAPGQPTGGEGGGGRCAPAGQPTCRQPPAGLPGPAPTPAKLHWADAPSPPAPSSCL